MLLTMLFAALFCAGCPGAGRNGAPAPAEGRRLARGPIQVTATVGMIADAVKNVGGERVHVTGLMGRAWTHTCTSRQRATCKH